MNQHSTNGADLSFVADGESCRERASRIQRVFIERAGEPSRNVLILCSGRSSANVPFEILLPTTTCCRIKYVIDYAEDEADRRLPPYDLVFNAVGEPDIAESFSKRLKRFAMGCSRPVLNHPVAVAKTLRHRLPTLLEDLEDVVVAPCIRLGEPLLSDTALRWRIADAAMNFPLLVRPVAAHGGKWLECCADIESLADRIRALNGACSLTEFRDYRSADSYYRKYRVICIGGEVFACHLAISRHWMVHYFSADMERHAWKIAEERRFLEDPCAALGTRAMQALTAISQRLGLDYGGIDFSLLPDGRVLVFEANATMLVQRERNDGVLAHKNPYVERIVDAFERQLARRTRA